MYEESPIASNVRSKTSRDVLDAELHRIRLELGTFKIWGLGSFLDGLGGSLAGWMIATNAAITDVSKLQH